MQFEGTITNQKLVLHDRLHFQHHVASLNGDVLLTIKPDKSTRTEKQNRYYWKILHEIDAETRQGSNSLHEFFKKKFNKKIVQVKDEVEEVGGSTTELSTKEFKDYVDNVKQYALYEFGISIVDPNEPPLYD